jgi:hypothetical protein
VHSELETSKTKIFNLFTTRSMKVVEVFALLRLKQEERVEIEIHS